jgi:uncharacterized membrane protein YphA (DoxX/SURF4 family)
MPSSSRLSSLGARIGAAVALSARLYVASIWWSFGLLKIRAGWLDLDAPTGNPLRPLLELIVAGQLPTTWPPFRPVARALLESGLDGALVVAIPLTEIALAVALAVGLVPRMAALVGIAVNLGLVAAGIGNPSLDGLVVALQLLVLATGSLAGAWGLPALALAAHRRVRRRVRRRCRDALFTSGSWPDPRGAAR